MQGMMHTKKDLSNQVLFVYQNHAFDEWFLFYLIFESNKGSPVKLSIKFPSAFQLAQK